MSFTVLLASGLQSCTLRNLLYLNNQIIIIMNSIKMKHLIRKHMATVSVPAHRSESTTTLGVVEKSFKKKFKFRKFLNFISPFIFVCIFIVLSSAVYFAVERHCQTNFYCPKVDLQIIDAENQTICRHLRTDQRENLKRSHPDLIPTVNYWESMHFVAITVTTIGYGDIIPCTAKGQGVILVSALIGLPLTLMALSRLGQTFGMILHAVWSRLYKRLKKAPYTEKREKQLCNKNYVPMTLALTVTVGWVQVCSLYFYITLKSLYRTTENKNFTYGNALYFTMISFLTIGYGEYAPIQYELIWPNLIMLMIGLALVAMCIRLFQAHMEFVVNDIVDMIDQEYTEILNVDDKSMSGNGRQAVKQLLNKKKQTEGFMTKLFVSSMAKSQEKRLAQIYVTKAKYTSSQAQATADCLENEIQTERQDQAADEPGLNLSAFHDGDVYYQDGCCQCDLGKQTSNDETNSKELESRTTDQPYFVNITNDNAVVSAEKFDEFFNDLLSRKK